MKRGFGVGTLEVSFEEGLEEAIEMSSLKVQKNNKSVLVEVASGCYFGRTLRWGRFVE